MNKRQAKKKFKKEHGYNPPRKLKMDSNSFEKFLSTLKETIADVAKMIVVAFGEFKRITGEGIEKIKTMPDYEFELLCEQLTLEQELMARRIRGK